MESLDASCLHPAATLQTRVAGDTLHDLLPDGLLGRRQAADLLVVDHHPAARRRLVEGPTQRQGALFVEPAVPVTNLLVHVLLHEDAFPGAEPELVAFETADQGLACTPPVG